MRFLITVGVLLFAAPLITAAADARTITVSGEASKDIRVSFSVVYIVTNKTKVLCQDFNPLAGLWTDRAKSYTYNVNNTSGHYTLELPLSELPTDTYCKWRPLEIRYAAVPRSASPDLYRSLLSIDKVDGKPVTRIDLRCTFKAVKSVPEPLLVCLGQNVVPNLLITISSNQRSLIGNFMMSSE